MYDKIGDGKLNLTKTASKQMTLTKQKLPIPNENSDTEISDFSDKANNNKIF